MKLELTRQVFGETFTLGELKVDGKHFGYTCEDFDRHLEDHDGGDKVFGETAISRGEYKVEVSFSSRFKKQLPILLDVPYFTGIRIHGGNTAADTHGCILLGLDRTLDGVKNCSERIMALTSLLEKAEDFGEEAWITIA